VHDASTRTRDGIRRGRRQSLGLDRQRQQNRVYQSRVSTGAGRKKDKRSKPDAPLRRERTKRRGKGVAARKRINPIWDKRRSTIIAKDYSKKGKKKRTAASRKGGTAREAAQRELPYNQNNEIRGSDSRTFFFCEVRGGEQKDVPGKGGLCCWSVKPGEGRPSRRKKEEKMPYTNRKTNSSLKKRGGVFPRT